jgi:adenylate cyclase
MGLYFSPRVLRDVIANPGCLQPKRAEITALLTDLRNSTDLAEKLGPEGMLELLNSIFAVENQAVFAEDGSLEKPVGDQFLAYWGAPDPQPDGPDRALRATYALISGLQDLRKTFDPDTRALFGFGVALHAGRCLIGNIGSAQFYHYGVVGDLLNATARVESLTKFYGVLVLVTRDVYDRFSTAPEARVLDRVVVKGKTSSLELLELRNPTSPENFKDIACSYAEAYGAYQVGDFKTAGQMFERTSASDRPSAVMAIRCKELQDNPPERWEGAYTFLNK